MFRYFEIYENISKEEFWSLRRNPINREIWSAQVSPLFIDDEDKTIPLNIRGGRDKTVNNIDKIRKRWKVDSKKQIFDIRTSFAGKIRKAGKSIFAEPDLRHAEVLSKIQLNQKVNFLWQAQWSKVGKSIFAESDFSGKQWRLVWSYTSCIMLACWSF